MTYKVEGVSRRYKYVFATSVIGTVLSLCGMISMFIFWDSSGKILMFFLSFFMGFFANLCLQGTVHCLQIQFKLNFHSVSIQIAIEVTFPISEETVANLIVFGAETATVLFILLLSVVKMEISCWVVLAVAGIPSLVLVILFHGSFRRTENEMLSSSVLDSYKR